MQPGARPRPQRGFTLIELLVTITIIAILVGAVVLNIEFRNVGASMRDTARRTALIMDLASDQAVYSRQQFGIRFHPAGYEFWMLVPDEETESESADDAELTWQPVLDERLAFRDTGVAVEFELELSGVPVVLAPLEEEMADATDEEPLKPHVMFLSNGEAMPDFRVLMADEEGEYRWQVATGEVQPIEVERLSSP